MPPKQPAKLRLGRLEQIQPVDFWQDSAEFTRWLAEADTLELLGEILGLELEVLPQGSDVDPELAPYCLYCRDQATDRTVLVVSQIEPTDAAHLGYLVAGMAQGTAIGIWLASNFQAEHQAALEWLNLGISEACFVGIAVELWRIGKDAAADFKPTVYPDGWVLPDAASELEEEEPPPEPEPLTEIQQENLAFWEQLCERLERRGSIVKAGTPVTESAMGFAIARAGFRLYAVIDREHGSLHTELLLSGEDAHPHFYLLAQEQDRIVEAIDLPLVWDDTDAKTCSIYCTLPIEEVCDRSRWKDYQNWLCDCLERFHETFSERIKRLDATDYQPLPDYGLNPLSNSLILPG